MTLFFFFLQASGVCIMVFVALWCSLEGQSCSFWGGQAQKNSMSCSQALQRPACLLSSEATAVIMRVTLRPPVSFCSVLTAPFFCQFETETHTRTCILTPTKQAFSIEYRCIYSNLAVYTIQSKLTVFAGKAYTAP